MEDILKDQQNIKLSGYCVSHQNGAAEGAIKVVATTTRTMLIHTELRFPEDTLTNDVWPICPI